MIDAEEAVAALVELKGLRQCPSRPGRQLKQVRSALTQAQRLHRPL